MRTYRAKISYLSGKPLCEAGDNCPGQTCQECWATTEDDFVVVYAVNVAYIGGAVFLAPRAKKDDGLIWLLMVRKGISRMRSLLLNNSHNIK